MSIPTQIAETVQTAHINREPSPQHDMNPSTAASQKTPAVISPASSSQSGPKQPSRTNEDDEDDEDDDDEDDEDDEDDDDEEDDDDDDDDDDEDDDEDDDDDDEDEDEDEDEDDDDDDEEEDEEEEEEEEEDDDVVKIDKEVEEVQVEVKAEQEVEEEIPLSVLVRPREAPRRRRSPPLPPMPDLRFEQSYLHSIARAQTWGRVAWITVRDQIMMPLAQGVLYNIAVLGWQHWNRGAQMSGSSAGARLRRWWYQVNKWPLPARATQTGEQVKTR